MYARPLVALALAGLLVAGPVAATPRAGPVRAETVAPLFRADLHDIPSYALTAVLVDYPAGGVSAPHHHRGSVFAYVVSGAVRSQVVPGGPVRTYRAGESFFEPAGSVHVVSANASSTAPARLLAVFVAPRSGPLTTEEHGSR